MIRLGIICPSEIALRRFLPALEKEQEGFRFEAIAIASPEEWFRKTYNIPAEAIKEQQEREMKKAEAFTSQHGGKIVTGYEKLVQAEDIDAIYIPLPPALHYRWAKMALEAGKHVFVEKPSTTTIAETDDLIKTANERGLALHENYMFTFHDQLAELEKVMKSGEIGDVRLYRICFGFPLRQMNDFRYNKALGGGALLDAGGYCLKYANHLMGESTRVVTAAVNHIENFGVEMFGTATLTNDKGMIAQIAFGMDNDYRCDIDIWGSKGSITSNRILTSPAGFVPQYTIKKNQEFETRDLPADDAFRKSIQHFARCIADEDTRKRNYQILHKQEELVEQFKEKAGKENWQ